MKKLILLLCMLPLLCSCVDGATKIGLDRLNWSQSLPSGEGITFSGTAPILTADHLYTDEGFIKFNGSAIGKEIINIESYGAIGDNSTDNSAAIQSAMDICMENHIPLYVPGGVFVIDSPLYIDELGGMQILGNGMAIGTQSGKSIIRYTGDGAAIRINRTPDAWVYSVCISDIVLWGDKTNNGIYIDHLSESSFKNVAFYRFYTAIDCDEVDITTFTNCLISECTNGFWNDEIRAVTFNNCNVWDNVVGFRFNDVYSTNIILSHFEKVNDCILIQNTEGDSSVKSLVIENNHFLCGDDMDIDCRVVRLSAVNATNQFEIDNMVLQNNYISLYDSSHAVEVDVSGTSGFCYGYTVLDSNKVDYIETAVITTDNTNFRWSVMNNRVYLDKPILSGDYGAQLGGFAQTYQDFKVYGPLRLDNRSGDQKGDIWIDPVTNEIKFYNGTGVRTIPSS